MAKMNLREMVEETRKGTFLPKLLDQIMKTPEELPGAIRHLNDRELLKLASDISAGATQDQTYAKKFTKQVLPHIAGMIRPGYQISTRAGLILLSPFQSYITSTLGPKERANTVHSLQSIMEEVTKERRPMVIHIVANMLMHLPKPSIVRRTHFEDSYLQGYLRDILIRGNNFHGLSDNQVEDIRKILESRRGGK